MGTLVADAQPLVAILLAEHDARWVEERLRRQRGDGEVLLTAVNLSEVLYTVRTRLGPHGASRAAALLRRVPISIVDVGSGLATHAAEVKARHHLGLGDCFAAALAIMTDSPLLTGDADFLPLAEHGLKIEWVGQERP